MRIGDRKPQYMESRAKRRFAWFPRHIDFHGQWIWWEPYWEVQTYSLKFGFLGVGDWAAWEHVEYRLYEDFPDDGSGDIPLRKNPERPYSNDFIIYETK